MQIDGRTFLVTGGGSGLGAACARRLAAAGGHVIVADVNCQASETLAGEIGSSAQFVETDVTDEASVRRAVDMAAQKAGGLAGAVNCAGIMAARRIVGEQGPHDLGLFARVVEINLIGTFNVLRLAAAAMALGPADEEGERGVIVNTASVAAFDGQIGQAAYAASKAGIVGLTLPAARDLAAYGIRVVTIAPGVFDTPMMASLSEEVRSSLAAQVPFPPRFGRPDEFAALVEHVIGNSMLNGDAIRIDGGLRMGAR